MARIWKYDEEQTLEIVMLPPVQKISPCFITCALQRTKASVSRIPLPEQISSTVQVKQIDAVMRVNCPLFYPIQLCSLALASRCCRPIMSSTSGVVSLARDDSRPPMFKRMKSGSANPDMLLSQRIPRCQQAAAAAAVALFGGS